jgi:leucyl aminopeptidase
VARHLTNLPPNILNPVTYADFAKGFLGSVKGLKVDVWDEKKLAAENMNLHLCVGVGSNRPPRLARIRYSGRGSKGKPVALVGKGITFDSGGLDIKPASGMRLMKKDMGGSAAVLAVAYWAAVTRQACALDCYLALAENSISSSAFRPSDVLTARSGLDVEIHNTDAEGRLVLADALDVAVKQKIKPRALVDVATLTGAIKVGLGAGIAGLFANDRKVEAGLQKAGQLSGDLNWPMPLYQKYRSMFSSNFADLTNSPDGFGGAITAALFLEKFVADVPWAHLDIYAWKDSADGAWIESGGSGQSVLSLCRWLSSVR